LAEMYDETEELFRLMSSKNLKMHSHLDSEKGLSLQCNDESHCWKPGIFTVAELIRAAKLSKKPNMALNVVMWALSEGTTLPSGVISDAISFVYGEGRTDIAFEMYCQIYKSARIQHWSKFNTNEILEIDLHKYSRGMAYAAIRCALKEIGDMLAQNKFCLDNLEPFVLTIITGKNIRESKEESASSFRISAEVQNILVEDFYPPISSSTLPGNAGRIIVNINDIILLKDGEEEQ
jgi:hypothetical protein